MNIFQLSGDIHGFNCLGASSVGGHHRPLDYDSGSIDFSRFRVLDNVGPDVGACIDTGDICDFCVCSGKSERKER